MPKETKIDKVELEKRIRIVQEWIIDDWHYGDIVTNIQTKWGISIAQAKRYVKTARDRWADSEQEIIDHKRRRKIETLKKLKRKLDQRYAGTPGGIRAILMVEREIAKLENLYPATKVEVSGKNGKPIETVNTNVNLPLTAEEIKLFGKALEEEY